MKHQVFTCQGQSVDTAHWDTVSAIHIEELNKAIRLAHTSPARFSKPAQEGVTISAKFGDWVILPDSDGSTLSMELPLRDLVVAEGGEQRRYDSARAMVDVHLELLPHDPRSNDNKQLFLLVVRTQPAPGNKQAAQVTKVTLDHAQSLVDEVYVTMGLGNWLNENLREFLHVFATVNIHKVVEQNEAFAWLKPTFVAYAFGYNGNDPNKSVLGVLCQTAGRSADGLIYQIEADAVPQGTTASYVISRARFLRDMFAGALPRAFEGLKADNILINKDDTGLSIKKPTMLKNFESDGKTYSPELLKLDVDLFDTELSIASVTKTRIIPGIYSVCSSIAHYAFGLVIAKSGAKSLGYFETRDPVTNNTTEKTSGAVITEIILAVIAVVVGLILTFVTFGAGSSVAVVLYVLLVGSVGTMTAMEIAELVGENDAPPVDLLVANAADAVCFSAGGRFDPTVAGLNGALQIGGNYVDDPSINQKAGADGVSLTPQAAFQMQFAARMRGRV